MSMRRENVHGFWIQYDEIDNEMRHGIRYLRDDLQLGEAKTLFESANRQGDAEFEDDSDRDWTLIYNRGDNIYTLVRRQRE